MSQNTRNIKVSCSACIFSFRTSNKNINAIVNWNCLSCEVGNLSLSQDRKPDQILLGKEIIYKHIKNKFENLSEIEKYRQEKIIFYKNNNKSNKEIAELISVSIATIAKDISRMKLTLPYQFNPNGKVSLSLYQQNILDIEPKQADLIESYIEDGYSINEISKILHNSPMKLETLVYKYLIEK